MISKLIDDLNNLCQIDEDKTLVTFDVDCFQDDRRSGNTTYLLNFFDIDGINMTDTINALTGAEAILYLKGMIRTANYVHTTG